MAGFGKGTDHFGLGSTTGFSFIESSKTPMAMTTEDALDQDGNVAGRDSYEAGPADAVECVYHLTSSTLDLSTLMLGPIDNGQVHLVITSIDVSTSNSAWPVITIGGFTSVTNYADMPNFALPAITINGKKIAQGLDFSVGADCRLTGSTLKASGDLAHTLDEDGEVVAMAFTGATCEIGGEAVEIEGAVTWTPGGSWIETQAPGASNSNTSWGTASFAANKYLEVYVEA